MNKGLKAGLVLLILGIICGTLLATVNYLTAEKIADNEAAAQFDALKEFYFDVEDDNFDSYKLTDLFALNKLELEDDTVDSIFILRDKENDDIEALGYLVSAYGYSGDAPILMLIVVNSDMSIQGYSVVSHKETTGFGADIVGNDFNISNVTDLSGFDSVSGVTFTSDGILECFNIVSQRVHDDFGGDLDD
ncbi:FMN-binding protein [Mycoplasmatota bacterium WC30]